VARVTAWHGCSIHPTNSCWLSITRAGVLRVLGHTKLGWRTRAYDSKLSQASAQAKRVPNCSLVAINDERISYGYSSMIPGVLVRSARFEFKGYRCAEDPQNH
jgi:hypothetical protein